MLAEKIRILMAKKGWKQVDLAKKSGISQGMINNILKGVNKKLQAPTLKKLADAFGIKIDELLADEIAEQKKTLEVDPEVKKIYDALPEDAKIFFSDIDKFPKEDVDAILRFIKNIVSSNKGD